MRVFVTGGAGVIGMELVPRLIGYGVDVLVGDLKVRPSEFSEKIRYRQGDLNFLTKAELDAFGPEIIIHLAATFERSTEALEFWDENFHHNVKLSHHLMTLAKSCESLRRVVFASSYLIYDQELYQFNHAQKSPRKLLEGDPVQPRNLTGMAKFLHEMELQFLESFSECKFTTICVRIFRGYGCRSRDVISRWVRSLLQGDGIFVYRPEGMFDYIYSADSAEGLVRLAFCQEARGIVNLGTGRSRRVSDVVQVLKKNFPGASITYEDSEIPFEASEAGIDKLQALTGWKPTRELDETIREIIEFEKRSLAAIRTREFKTNPVKAILLTSASRKMPLLHALKDAAQKLDSTVKVITADLDALAICQYEADGFWHMPPLVNLTIEEIINQCRLRSISLILPTRDGELEFWSLNREVLVEHGINVIVSPQRSIERCRDKLKFADECRSLGLLAIPAAITPEQFSEKKLVVKERFGSGSVGIGLNLSYEQALEHARTLEQPIFQPFIEGREISVDAWISKSGRVGGVVLRHRDRVIAGESQITTTFRDVAMEEQASEFVARLDLYGPVVLQAIASEDGKLHVIECNPRFGGASTASIAVGLDSLYWSMAEFFDPEFQPYFDRACHEIRQVRMPVDRLIYDNCF